MNIQHEFNCTTKFLCGDKALERLTYDLMYFNSSRVLLVIEDKYYRSSVYRSFSRAMINSEADFNNLVLSGSMTDSELLDRVIEQYYSSDCNAIVVLSDYRIIDIVKVARVAVSQGLHSCSQLNSVSGGVNNIPLIVVQCGYGGRNAASSKAAYINQEGVPRVLIGIELAPNAVVIDERMGQNSREKSIVNGLYSIATAISATFENVSVFNKGFLLTAIELAQRGLFDTKMHATERKVALIAAVTYAGVGQDKSDDSILGRLAYIISKKYNILFKIAFYILTPHALDMYLNKNSLGNSDYLAALIGNDELVKVKPDQRTIVLIEHVKAMYSNYGGKQIVPVHLSELGIQPEQLEDIYYYGVELKYFTDAPDIKRSVIDLLSRAL